MHCCLEKGGRPYKMKVLFTASSLLPRLDRRQKVGVLVFFLFFALLIPLLTLLVFQKPKPQQSQKQTVGTEYFPANIEYEPSEGYGVYKPANLANPNISAIDLNMNWSAVEPQQGVFDWAPADKVAAAWASKGKQIVIVVRYIHEISDNSSDGCDDNGQYLPSWEIARIPTYCDFDKNTVVPDYFNATFQSDLKAYIQAIADHFANSPYRNDVAYARVGVGVGAEGYYLYGVNQDCGTGNACDFQTDKQQLIARGYTPHSWAVWQEQMLAAFHKSFSYTQLIYPIVQQDVDQVTGEQVSVEVAKWAAAHGIGLGEEGLLPSTVNTSYAGMNIIFPYIQSQYPGTYIQFQTVSGVSSIRNVRGDIQAAEQLGACSIEWYGNVAVNPSYQSLFAEWQQYVNTHCQVRS